MTFLLKYNIISNKYNNHEAQIFKYKREDWGKCPIAQNTDKATGKISLFR